jgi:hypothetical protein
LTFLIAVILITVIAVQADARIGETLQQCPCKAIEKIRDNMKA